MREEVEAVKEAVKEEKGGGEGPPLLGMGVQPL